VKRELRRHRGSLFTFYGSLFTLLIQSFGLVVSLVSPHFPFFPLLAFDLSALESDVVAV